ncbi:MAG: RNA-binding S4 domain-containing protein [Nitrosomonas sp.]|nr:RNA-binding S4 domain-containing protein [Nitrosomonas sp.]
MAVKKIPSSTTPLQHEKCRIDKWLFAARFFKTRSLAAEAIEKGRVQVNGVRAKSSKTLNEGDRLDIRIGEYRYHVNVLALSNRRGSAAVAQMLYQETEESRIARQELTERLRMQPRLEVRGRPTKRVRRNLQRLINGE